ncbi:hypothetical protein [Oceanobacter mangrovi]|uniref:hypothetical protein n=1 Tax=Oceanobacter mangrovi TaxID=2862510 RepID=UPI001C8ECC60|nr:hypothetical protein [Oceanobacter mangrovi]
MARYRRTSLGALWIGLLVVVVASIHSLQQSLLGPGTVAACDICMAAAEPPAWMPLSVIALVAWLLDLWPQMLLPFWLTP